MDVASSTDAPAENVGDVLVEIAKDVVAAVLGPKILQPLIPKTQIFVKQKRGGILPVCPCMNGWTNKRYDVKDSHGRNIYNIIEDSNCCCRFCLKSRRPFHMAIEGDNDHDHAIVVHRKLACDSCLFGCCLNEVKVYTETGKYLGKVRQNWTCWKSKFEVRDSTGDLVCKIKGPACPCSACGGNIDFEIFAIDNGIKIGAITKYWSGIATEIFTDADSFSVTFPIEMDPEVKATLIGACLLIDFMYFEEKG